MNKKLVFVLTFIFVLSFALLVVAAQDFNVVLDPIGDQEYSSLPQTFDVTGIITGDENAKINWIKLYINDNPEESLLFNDTEIGENGYRFSIPWDIEDEGIFRVKVLAEIAQDGGITIKDTERNVEISLSSDSESGVVLDSIGDQEYSSFPQTYNVTGTITGDENAEIKWIKLYIDNTLEKTLSFNDTEIGENGYRFTITWKIEDEGVFDIKVVAKISEDGGITREDTESDVEISLSSEEEDGDEATENNPAAPAIANKILKDSGVKHNYGGGNYISDVAREFRGVDKNSEDYEEQVRSYLENHEAWDKDTEIQDNKPGKGKGNAYGLNKEKNNNALENGNKKNK